MYELKRDSYTLQLLQIILAKFAAHQHKYWTQTFAARLQQMQGSLCQQTIIALNAAVQLFFDQIHILVQQTEYLHSFHSFTRVSRLWLQSSIFTSCGSRPIS